MNDQSKHFQQQIQTAFENKTACNITGGGSKSFLGNASTAKQNISTKDHTGIISYDASELVITVRSGTLLKDIDAALAENNQSLPFEPPAFSNNATIGGTIACNLSGPARAYCGAARDFVLGAHIINGKGDDLHFGGQVMKNVAGYDASRLMAGAYGTLGLILDVSLKVLPITQTEITIKSELPENVAIQTINELSAQNLPITASCYINHHLYIRLNSSEKNTQSVSQFLCKKISATEIDDSKTFWLSVKEQQHEFFNSDKPVTRLSLPATTAPVDFDGTQLIEWGGAQRWLKSDLDIEQIRHTINQHGGHASLYRGTASDNEFFHPLEPGVKALHQCLKQAFDPAGILNPGRLYKEL